MSKSAYPHLSPSPGDPIISTEEYPALLAKYGPSLVMLTRQDGGSSETTVMLAPLEVVRIGNLTRFLKAVEAAAVAPPVLNPDDYAELTSTGRPQILVCSSPLSPMHTLLLIEMAVSEACYIRRALAALQALDAVNDIVRPKMRAPSDWDYQRWVDPVTGLLQWIRRADAGPDIASALLPAGTVVEETAATGDAAAKEDAGVVGVIRGRGGRAYVVRRVGFSDDDDGETDAPDTLDEPAAETGLSDEEDDELWAKANPKVQIIVDDLIRFFKSARLNFDARGLSVKPPIGEWNIYTGNYSDESMDRLARAIKGYASASARVSPPLPTMDPEEAEAFCQLFSLLNGYTWRWSTRVYAAAMVSPAAALLIHNPRVMELAQPGSRWRVNHRQQTPDPTLYAIMKNHADASYRVFNALRRHSESINDTTAQIGIVMLEYLLSEELTAAARRDEVRTAITKSTPYVLTLPEILRLEVPHAVSSVEEAVDRLDIYVGGYLRELDLSRTLITGSAVAAALIVTDVEREDVLWTDCKNDWHIRCGRKRGDHTAWCEHCLGVDLTSVYRQYIAAVYAPAKTVPIDRSDYNHFVEGLTRDVFDLANHLTQPEESSEGACVLSDDKVATCVSLLSQETAVDPATGETILTLTRRRPEKPLPHGRHGYPHGDSVTLYQCPARLRTRLRVTTGADLDMAIDVATDEEFDAVVVAHYAVIRRHHPHAVLKRVPRADPDDPRYNWEIVPGDLAAMGTFRRVEMYRANFNHVVTHHVGMVSGAYTAMYSGGTGPEFLMSARMAISMAQLATPQYYYFASRKQPPQEVIVKYMQRGFGLQGFPAGIRKAIGGYMSQDPIWGQVLTGDNTHLSRWVGHSLPALYAMGNFSAYNLPADLRVTLQYEEKWKDKCKRSWPIITYTPKRIAHSLERVAAEPPERPGNDAAAPAPAPVEEPEDD